MDVQLAVDAIALNSAAAAESLRKHDPRRTSKLVRNIRQLARAGMAEMRAVIFELRAESLAEEGLVAALTKQSAAMQARHDLKIRVKLSQEPPGPLASKEALYRIAQEALHNVVKHAQAHTAELTLELDQTTVLTVRDFEPAGSFPGHFGLRSMHERAKAVGGILLVDSTPQLGTVIRVSLPVGEARV